MHVIEEDVSVDVGEDDVERAISGYHLGSPKADFDVFRMVQADIFARIVVCPFVNIYGYDPRSSFHPCQYSQHRRAASHVEHFFSLKVELQDFAYHQVCRRVVSGAECHLRVYYYIIGIARFVGVERGAYQAFVPDMYGLEIILFPFFIPIFAFNP